MRRLSPWLSAQRERHKREFSGAVFAVTLDVDWASDAAISDTVDLIGSFGIVPICFVTHRSAAIDELAENGRIELGIHPNFLPGSSHGANPAEVFDFCLDLCPQPLAFRSHGFSDSSAIVLEARRRGLRFDSNLCLCFQPEILPIWHWAGMWRLPVFWEDDIHWRIGATWDLDEHIDAFLTPGLKIINVHPFVQSLNIPDQQFYDANAHSTRELTAAKLPERRHAGAGARTFLASLLDHLTQRSHQFARFSKLCSIAEGKREDST